MRYKRVGLAAGSWRAFRDQAATSPAHSRSPLGPGEIRPLLATADEVIE
jgi:hypothetical protein